MIKDPYIGMPITMGGRCDSVPKPPARPPQNANPDMPGGSGSTGGSGGSGGSGSAGTSAGFDGMYLGSLPIAMAYTPMQQWKTTYSPENGLSRGTIFPELDLPFEGRTILTEQKRGGRNNG